MNTTREVSELVQETLRLNLAENGDEHEVIAQYLADLDPSARATIIQRAAQLVDQGYDA